MAVGDAADEGEVFAAAALELVRSGAAGTDEVNGAGSEHDDACGDSTENFGVLVRDQLRDLVERVRHGGEIRISRRGRG